MLKNCGLMSLKIGQTVTYQVTINPNSLHRQDGENAIWASDIQLIDRSASADPDWGETESEVCCQESDSLTDDDTFSQTSASDDPNQGSNGTGPEDIQDDVSEDPDDEGLICMPVDEECDLG